jgi:hypothetical protein
MKENVTDMLYGVSGKCHDKHKMTGSRAVPTNLAIAILREVCLAWRETNQHSLYLSFFSSVSDGVVAICNIKSFTPMCSDPSLPNIACNHPLEYVSYGSCGHYIKRQQINGKTESIYISILSMPLFLVNVANRQCDCFLRSHSCWVRMGRRSRR